MIPCQAPPIFRQAVLKRKALAVAGKRRPFLYFRFIVIVCEGEVTRARSELERIGDDEVQTICFSIKIVREKLNRLERVGASETSIRKILSFLIGYRKNYRIEKFYRRQKYYKRRVSR